MRDAKVPHHGVPLGPVGVGRTAVEEPIGAPSLAKSLQEVKDALVLQAAMLPASKSRCLGVSQMNVGNTVASHGVARKDEVGSPQVEEFGRMEHAQETDQGDRNEGGPIPGQSQSSHGLHNGQRNDWPALPGLDGLPFMIDLSSRPERTAVLWIAVLSGGDRVDEQVTGEADGKKMQPVGSKCKGEVMPAGHDTRKRQPGFVGKPGLKSRKALSHPLRRG